MLGVYSTRQLPNVVHKFRVFHDIVQSFAVTAPGESAPIPSISMRSNRSRACCSADAMCSG